MKNGKSQKDEKGEKFGADFGLFAEVIKTSRRIPGADRDFWKILAHDIKEFRKLVEQVRSVPMFLFSADYRKLAFEDLLERGDYGFVYSSIFAENLVFHKKTSTGWVEFRLLRFPEEKTPFEFNVWLKKQPDFGGTADILDLLLLGVEQPDFQLSFPIIASFSRNKDSIVPCLSVRDVGEARSVEIRASDKKQPIDTRFLSVRFVD